MSNNSWQQYLAWFERPFIKQNIIINSYNAWLALPKNERPFYIEDDRISGQIPIVESAEPLIDLRQCCHQYRSNIQFTSGSAYGARDQHFRLRWGAAERLLRAEQLLQNISQQRLTFLITDAWRSLTLQRQYFESIKVDLAKTGLRDEALYKATIQVISDPAVSPPHVTGGTVDLTLYDLTKQHECDLGTKVDEIHDERIYTWHPKLSTEQKNYRAQLYYAMIQAGFTNFANEWWHYSYGNREWSLRTDLQPAHYDVITPSVL